MSERPMLVINVSRIPPEGLGVEESLEPGEVHLEGEESFTLAPGGRLESRLERAEDDSVHVRGTLSARLRLQCGRCLESFELPVEQDLDLFYLRRRHDDQDGEEDEVELSDRDMVVAYYDGDRLDLGEMVREQFFLTVPLKRLCREECRGLCPACGANRNQVRCACPPEPAASPFGSLRSLFEDKDR
ncbi:MAG: hypothetical protein DMF80_10345 [Acidobacteria bacterium]|nr:MAG: hypothetical protein DMF80_10345 [Acidobacteriota bacterium]